VQQANTSTTVTSSVNPSRFGQSVTFTATVSVTSPGAGTPTGTVTFKDGTTTLGTGTLNASDQATFTTSALSVGSHSITAVYNGDSNFNTSTSSVLTQTVNKGDTTTALTSSNNPSVYGQSVTFTATVTATAPAAGTPSGTVTFKDGTSNVTGCTNPATLNGSGVATCATSTLAAGTHSITAVYGSDTNFNGSTSPPVSQVVNKASTTTAVSMSPTAFSGPGQSVTLTATVSSTTPTPTGTVTFYDGTKNLGTAPLNSSGVATFTTTLDAGPHTITATYSGDSNYSASTSPAPVITSVTGPVGPLQAPAMATITVTFTDAATDTHTCAFSWDDGGPNSTGTVTEPAAGNGFVGSCQATHAFPVAGVYTIGVTVADVHGGLATSVFQFVVVYDANAGFVTGGGWIMSPAGALVASPTVTGKANFGFVSKYEKGKTIPTGNTEFQFQEGNFNFHSTVYEWLVISGAKAQYRGSGTVNGGGDYGFLLTGTDGKVSGGGGVDKFRIKIWNKTGNVVVYDNAPGSDDINFSNQTALGGGSIVIHK
jgi:hypothetical protein